MKAYHLFAATLCGLVGANLGVVERAEFDIDWNEGDFSKEGVFLAGEPAAFIESVQGVEKNETLPQLQDRSAELYGRQQCQSGYGYCSGALFLLIVH